MEDGSSYILPVHNINVLISLKVPDCRGTTSHTQLDIKLQKIPVSPLFAAPNKKIALLSGNDVLNLPQLEGDKLSRTNSWMGLMPLTCSRK